MRLLSIIIPIYNVEPYVEKCLRSLETQDIPQGDYEIICVNDGSPDNSREVVIRLQEEFKNIVLIDQKNQGVSMARNSGVKISKGRYLLFIDPDDFVHPNCIFSILGVAIESKAQIVVPSFTFTDSDGNLLESTIFDCSEGRMLTGIEGYGITHMKGQMGADLAVGIVFEADFVRVNELYFLPNVPFLEDGEFLARAHCLAERCLLTQKILYSHVVARQGSATHSDLFNSEKARKGFVISATNLRHFQRSQQLDQEQIMFINGSIVQFVLLVIYSAIRTRSLNILNTEITNLKAVGLEKLRLEGCKGWYLKCGKPYNVSPYLGAIALSFYFKWNSWSTGLFRKKLRKKR